MKKALLFFVILTGLFACKQNNKFYVVGKVTDSEGKMLYFEQNGLMKTTVLDSVKLGKSGEFSFKSQRQAYPDFFNLRIENKTLTFAIDSCEEVQIDAKFENFATNYVLTGSETSLQIQKLRKSVMNIQRKVNEITPEMSATERTNIISGIEKDIESHKEMARKLILQNPRSLAAYFAIYQRINNNYLFSPYIKSDKPYCSAVATSFNVYMPDYIRTKNLYSLVLDAIKNDQDQKEKEAWNDILTKNNTGFIDINLPDKNNAEQKLSSLKGKVVLIDFSSTEMEGSIDYVFALRDLYNKYHNRGFEIYQVSLDQNKEKWRQSIVNIPWISVRDENGANTNFAGMYNVKSIPTSFLMNRKGLIICRNSSFKELMSEIEKNL
jgi:peroxiredoxin